MMSRSGRPRPCPRLVGCGLQLLLIAAPAAGEPPAVGTPTVMVGPERAALDQLGGRVAAFGDALLAALTLRSGSPMQGGAAVLLDSRDGRLLRAFAIPEPKAAAPAARPADDDDPDDFADLADAMIADSGADGDGTSTETSFNLAVVGLAGGTGVVALGTPYAGPSVRLSHGAVHVFDAATGAALGTLGPTPTPTESAYFGFSVAIAGDRLFVGAPAYVSELDQGSLPGAVYVYRLPDLLPVRVLAQPAGALGFGAGLATANGELLVTAPAARKAFLFDAATGALRLTLAPASGSGADAAAGAALCRNDSGGFGESAALTDGVVLIGAPQAGGAGAVCVFDRRTGALRRALRPPKPVAGALFGYALAAAGPRALVGAHGKANGPAYVLDIESGALLAELQPPAALEHASFSTEFGVAVAWLGGHPVVGAPQHGDKGAVVVYPATPAAAGPPPRR